MSNFQCKECGVIHYDTKDGYKLKQGEMQPPPQTFEELAKLKGAKLERYTDNINIFFYIELKINEITIKYYNDGRLDIIDKGFNNISLLNISPPQAYEIITVMQRNIGGA